MHGMNNKNLQTSVICISDLSPRRCHLSFCWPMLGSGINYRPGKASYFTGNLQYKIAPLKESIGSVTAFTGSTPNAGIGFNFSIKREKHD
jgi:hypothetical protein